VELNRTPTIAIVGASAGSGHMCAASSLEAAFKATDLDAHVYCLDSFDLLSPFQRSILKEGWQLGSLWCPALYSRIHRGLVTNPPFPRWRQVAGEAAGARLVRLLGPPDAFIATHPAAVAIGAALAQGSRTRLFVVATDFVLHALHYHPTVDSYYVPPGCRLMGVEASVGPVVESGIPLSPSFWRADSRRTSKDTSGRVAVVSFGGRAFLASESIPLIDRLCTMVDKVVILCGSETRSAIDFATTLRENHKAADVRYTASSSDVAAVLTYADMFFGKPGGISVSEALCFGLPIGILATLPGQEEYNRDFLVRAGLGTRVFNVESMLQFVQAATHWDYKKSAVWARPDSSLAIVRSVLSHLEVSGGGNTVD
jgi:processive 1,2-diacylglycerol beta-glucosyltransferase